MISRSYLPTARLRPFVKAITVTESMVAGSYKVLPGTSVVMGFQYSGRLGYKSSDQHIPLGQAGITGLNDSFREFSNIDNTHSILVMFTATGAAAFLRQPVNDLFRQSLSLDDLMLRSKMDAILEQISDAASDIERVNVVERFLLSSIDTATRDELVEAAVQIIVKHRGNLTISHLAAQLFISQSRFEKRFRTIVGTSAKKFAGIVRLRSLLEAPVNEKNLTALGLSAGYFDQAHFIKDFRGMTGETPEAFFKK